MPIACLRKRFNQIVPNDSDDTYTHVAQLQDYLYEDMVENENPEVKRYIQMLLQQLEISRNNGYIS